MVTSSSGVEMVEFGCRVSVIKMHCLKGRFQKSLTFQLLPSCCSTVLQARDISSNMEVGQVYKHSSGYCSHCKDVVETVLTERA